MRLSGSDWFECCCECQDEIVMLDVPGIMRVMAFAIWNVDGMRVTVSLASCIYLESLCVLPVMASMGYTAKEGMSTSYEIS
jgi:hypothetical protein